MSNEPLIFCAIDTPDVKEAAELARRIGPVTGGIKLGLEFFNANGPQGLEAVLKACPDAALFLDLKFHDIPNTVAGAVRSICRNFAPLYLNVHAAGGHDMMKAAKEAAWEMNAGRTRLLAVTILTSIDEQTFRNVGYAGTMPERVAAMALLTQKAGLEGVVCSAHEIETLRSVLGKNFVLMVPGIRPAGANSGDQKRVMTPAEAVQKGASHLVVGRPITQADSPEEAARAILTELAA